jgi:hypothetical protein
VILAGLCAHHGVTHVLPQEDLCAAVTNWAMERRRGAGAGGVKTVQWLG